MFRVIAISLLAWVATITAMIYTRGELAFGGEMIIPVLISIGAVMREEARE